MPIYESNMSEKFSLLFSAMRRVWGYSHPETPSAPKKLELSSKPNYLLFLDDIDSSFDVGESMHCG